eukprot:10850997-Heterocapsa_arctica.AAC.1
MHSSLAISGSEGYKAASAGSEGSGKPAYPVFGPKPVKAGPALMGESASGSGPAPDSAEATRQFVNEFVRSSGSESGVTYGPTTTMRKRESIANRRVGVVTTPSERVRKTS